MGRVFRFSAENFVLSSLWGSPCCIVAAVRGRAHPKCGFGLLWGDFVRAPTAYRPTRAPAQPRTSALAHRRRVQITKPKLFVSCPQRANVSSLPGCQKVRQAPTLESYQSSTKHHSQRFTGVFSPQINHVLPSGLSFFFLYHPLQERKKLSP